jgi:hydrogenase-4 component F
MVILIGFICATAMPPSGLFVSEFMIFSAMFKAHQIVVLVLIMLLLTMIIWAFGKNIFKLLFTPVEDFDDRHVPKINPLHSLSQFGLIGLSIYLGLNPPVQFVNLIQEAIKNLPH